MINQVVLVGRIVDEIQFEETESKIKTATITLAIPRNFKNNQGEYEIDFIPCILFKGIAENTTEFCKKGDLIGVKGRVQKLENDNSISIIAERVTFLSNVKEKGEE